MLEVGGERIFAVLELDFQLLFMIGRCPMTAGTITFFREGVVVVRRHDYDSRPLWNVMPLVSMVIIVNQLACVQIYSKIRHVCSW